MNSLEMIFDNQRFDQCHLLQFITKPFFMKKFLMKTKGYIAVIVVLLFICGFLVVLLFIGDSGRYCAPITRIQEHPYSATSSLKTNQVKMVAIIPPVLDKEHDGLNQELESVILSGGATGKSAENIRHLLQIHLVKEEQYALLPLGALPLFSNEQRLENSDSVIDKAQQLELHLAEMKNENKMLLLSIDEMSNAANQENRNDVIELAKKLRLHLELEEEILYPAAIVSGKYLLLRNAY